MGPKIAEKLQRLGVTDVHSLLLHLPYRYEDRTRITPIHQIRAGQKYLIEAEIELANVVFGKKRMLVVRVADRTGVLNLRFFHFNDAQKRMLKRGLILRCFGEARFSFGQHIEMIHPEYTVINPDHPPALARCLTPVYPVTEGLHQLKLRKLIEQALGLMRQNPQRLLDPIPKPLQEEFALTGLHEAIQFVHQPPATVSTESLAQSRSQFIKRLAFDELLAHHLGLRRIKYKLHAQAAPVMPDAKSLFLTFSKQLPFELTRAQQTVIEHIQTDLQSGAPMMRLLQGDVGSGKTLVAAFAALQAIASGYQAALMVPTELLAEQHYQSFCTWFEPLGLSTELLSGKLGASRRRETLARLQSNACHMVVGTHALFQQDVEFAKLGLVIVDEQHRFGVHQRLALKEKGAYGGAQVHQLIMTATPIPRTLAMTAYADLDVSVIDELPAGRLAINTVAISQDRRTEVIDRVHAVCQQSQQAYWVCTLIEESESLQCQAAEDTAQLLEKALSDLRIGLVHGRMKPQEKEKTMQAFKTGHIDLLVATTVIEVGVDVPNASLIIIENAERLGLAQLHQLRGRVGRGNLQSHCVLLYQAPLNEVATERLKVMRESNDGFFIAQKDLELRGPGEVLGTRQTGSLFFRVADLSRDQDLLPLVQACATQLFEQWPQTVETIVQTWIQQQESYAGV